MKVFKRKRFGRWCLKIKWAWAVAWGEDLSQNWAISLAKGEGDLKPLVINWA